MPPFEDLFIVGFLSISQLAGAYVLTGAVRELSGASAKEIDRVIVGVASLFGGLCFLAIPLAFSPAQDSRVILLIHTAVAVVGLLFFYFVWPALVADIGQTRLSKMITGAGFFIAGMVILGLAIRDGELANGLLLGGFFGGTGLVLLTSGVMGLIKGTDK